MTFLEEMKGIFLNPVKTTYREINHKQWNTTHSQSDTREE